MLTSSVICSNSLASTRSLSKCKSGQAAVFGLFALVILSIGLYTSYNLSRAVVEKIELQNIADAQAYSLATVEARSFNFIAFCNRTQIAHYSAIMAMQSLVSYLTYLESSFGYLKYQIKNMNLMAKYGGGFMEILGGSISLIPFYGWVVGPPIVEFGYILKHEVSPAIEIAWDIINGLYKGMGGIRKVIDNVGAGFSWLLLAMNYIYFVASYMIKMATNTLLLDDGFNFALKNDSGLKKPAAIATLLGALNAAEYTMAFDYSFTELIKANGAAIKDKKKYNVSKKGKEAQVVMTELVNASRGKEFVVDRSTYSMMGDVLSRAYTSVQDELDQLPNIKNKNNDDVKTAKRFQERFAEFTNQFKGVMKELSTQMGETKLVEDSQTGDNGLKVVKTAEAGKAKFSDGTALVAMDTVKLPVFNNIISGRLFGIHAGVEHSYHNNYTEENFWGDPDKPGDIFAVLDFIRNALSIFNVEAFTVKKTDCKDHKKHPWLGIQPYLKFNPKSDKKSFNQPDVWVWINKAPEDMRMADNADLHLSKDGWAGAEFNGDIGDQGLLGTNLLPGINAIARAQVYYHRPGVWHEHPNFFNPFWRARLAPISDAWSALTDKVSNATLRNLLSNGLIAH